MLLPTVPIALNEYLMHAFSWGITIEEAGELFRVELESFHLTLKKAVLICEAERRQVEQYEREKQRIGVW